MEKTKTKVTTIALILTLTFAATLIICLPTIKAQTVQYADSYIYINGAPNPVGVNQRLLITVWTALLPPLGVKGSWDAGWDGITVEVTKPDETKQTIPMPLTDSVGATWIEYTPDQIGPYYLQANFPAVWKNTTTTQTYYSDATSTKVEITVQQEPIEKIPDYPLPTEYWARPISGENREWWSISGSWLGSGIGRFGVSAYNASGNFNPYTKAPNTAHIVWTKPIAFGGLIGGEFGSQNYYTGLAYETKFVPPVIINGRLYYSTPDPPRYGFVCVDIRTGEQLWWKNGTITMGQIYHYSSPNQHGGIPYLWDTSGSTWHMYDAFTGNWILSLANASRPSTGGTQKANVMFSPQGDMLVYILDGRNNWLAMWNSSRLEGMLGGETGTAGWQWRPPTGATLDWRTGIQWNVSIPDVSGTQSIQAISSDLILAASVPPRGTYPAETVHVAYDAKTGKQLWVQNLTLAVVEMFKCALGEGVYIVQDQANLQWIGFDADSGSRLWVTEPYENALGMYIGVTHGAGWVIAYGKFYTLGYDGRVHAYDIKTGNHLWDYDAGSSGLDTPWGTWPFGGALTVADGKIYVCNYEDFPDSPMWKGFKLHVVNAETGEGVWSISGWNQVPIIADSHLVIFNAYDQQIYCISKGPSAVTVEASPKVSVHGNSVLIEGSVTDMSAGTKSDALTARFPNGVPAIADEYMTEWMEYLYMQKPMPMDAMGVPVTLDAIDPNGNFISIGRVTSDMSGFYSYQWTPEHVGKYTIIATFEGSESYWSSYAETAVGIDPAPSPSGPIEPEPSEAPLITTEMAIIVAAVIVAVAVIVGFWIIRKRK